MLNFTRDERLVLVCFSVIFFTGTLIKAAGNAMPRLARLMDTIESDRIFLRLELNAADADALAGLPAIGEFRAKEIAGFRDRNGAFADCAQLKNISGIGGRVYEKIAPRITVNGQDCR